jgi:vacuolar-type H+-ATPase subunit E/Vma4
MAVEAETLQSFSEAVRSRAQADADRVLAGARAKADGIRARGRETAGREREAILADARKKAKRIHDQAVAGARLQAEMRRLAAREKLLADVFAAARAQLAGVNRRPDYDRVLRALLRDALAGMETDAASVRADPQARAILTGGWLEKMSQETGVRLTLGPELQQGTGLILESGDGRRQFDNTLETRLERMQYRLRAGAFRLLAGEGT